MQKITPFFWFDNQAEEAAELYTSLIDGSRITNIARYTEDSPGQAGSVMTVSFELGGQVFTALNGGPVFSFTPAHSLFVSCESEEELDRIWGGLVEGGQVMMELGEYPFSKKFGWVADRFGLTWQLNLAPRAQKIAPFFLFVGKHHGRAEEAMRMYLSQFEDSSIEKVERFAEGENGEVGRVKHGVFSLAGQDFMAMDSNFDHQFTFTPAFSLFVACETQEEIDRFWDGLSEGGETSQCGWLTDRYGVSWQIVPRVLGEMLQDRDGDRVYRVTQSMLKMTKLDIAELQRAYERE